ncbi:ribose-phosphate diphosphokinase [Paenibacillus eucommiae]|uniref:ribose-phosphate diphosphokinase n=1 Tax=Paenibacillus eucommiae TaxID=1355755 RepID=A0ABS4IQD9_9BACL|nr:ribose-phosphate pyrophosphokinase [Paenibacillus eucommiae]MBP1988829.1 ribose-phosphate pyrophosphokinase [Paenibacillus eucommiae]
MDGEIKVFGGSTGKLFAQRMCEYMGIELGISEVIKFSDGNLFVKAGETVRDKDVYLVQPIGLNPNDEFTEILFWMDAFKRASANSVTVIIPYFGYAKGDKKDEPRVSIRARVCADCIELAGADRVLIMDLHSPQIQGFFKKPVDHLFALPLLCEYVKSLDFEDFVVVSPDVGFAKQARNYAAALKAPVAIGDKTRKFHDERAEVLQIIGNVEGKNALIVDDFSISGGTLVDLAEGLKERGAKRIFACLSHLLLSKSGAEKVDNSPIELIISTDSIEHPELSSQKIKIVSVAPLFAEAIMRIHNRESISSLFDSVPDKVLQYSIGIKNR